MVALMLLAALPAAEGGFDWGRRLPTIVAEAPARGGPEAWVVEVHTAADARGLRLRLTFDRPAAEALYLRDGTPVSGRLRAAVYLDTDDDRTTGLDEGPRDLRTGAERRLDVEVISVGADAEEKRPGRAVVAATLRSLTREGRRRVLWRGDDSGAGGVSVDGRFVEIVLPAAHLALGPRARLVLDLGGRTWAGRINP
ncbi:MAG: hypothetical protein DMF80_00615 [Acidobacteria bacterium]|nr:MAG: hypothetical protein DMF80_00615 [Acidobacteriota bacterium]PYQ22555.1 MAG: hypothetical protein DMF81_11750 [Acidobacteriota bacterium]